MQETLLALTDGIPAGALCFARFSDHFSVEIVFLAVKAEICGAGIGRSLLRRMQTRVKPENLRSIVASADNSAIPSFKQMGFQKHFPTGRRPLSLPRSSVPTTTQRS
jgi:N-acetylglutamate synthase-like GNAT family acetyltransferase